MKVKIGVVFTAVVMILPAWACQTASGLVEQVGIQLEQEFGEGGGLGLEFLDDGLAGLSSFCKLLAPMGIFM
jgi:hypothetical protein